MTGVCGATTCGAAQTCEPLQGVSPAAAPPGGAPHSTLLGWTCLHAKQRRPRSCSVHHSGHVFICAYRFSAQQCSDPLRRQLAGIPVNVAWLSSCMSMGISTEWLIASTGSLATGAGPAEPPAALAPAGWAAAALPLGLGAASSSARRTARPCTLWSALIAGQVHELLLPHSPKICTWKQGSSEWHTSPCMRTCSSASCAACAAAAARESHTSALAPL